ncbi:unnamed protein product, partial [Rangifer tarandus platyrhynchus]
KSIKLNHSFSLRLNEFLTLIFITMTDGKLPIPRTLFLLGIIIQSYQRLDKTSFQMLFFCFSVLGESLILSPS